MQRYLIEFAVGYRSSGTNSEVMPTTMKTYILGIQRVFNEWGFELKLTTGPVFGNPKTGLISVLNNKFSEQQS